MSTRTSTLSQTDSAYSELASARSDLALQLRQDALIIGDVQLSSGKSAKYLIDAKRVLLAPRGFNVLTELIRAFILKWEATAVGGLTLGADAIACAAVASGEPVTGFFVRKDAKAHGLQRLIEGPLLKPADRCLIVDDVVTSGASTIQAIDAVKAAGLTICGVLSVLDRLDGGGDRISAAAHAPYASLVTIDDVYPERPDR